MFFTEAAALARSAGATWSWANYHPTLAAPRVAACVGRGHDGIRDFKRPPPPPPGLTRPSHLSPASWSIQGRLRVSRNPRRLGFADALVHRFGLTVIEFVPPSSSSMSSCVNVGSMSMGPLPGGGGHELVLPTFRSRTVEVSGDVCRIDVVDLAVYDP